MPGEGKEPFGLLLLHDRLLFDVLVARMSNLATRDLAGYELAIQFHTEPLAKLAVIRERTPDPRNWRLEFNALLDRVVHVKQPPGCILAWRGAKSNPLGALSSRPPRGVSGTGGADQWVVLAASACSVAWSNASGPTGRPVARSIHRSGVMRPIFAMRSNSGP